jgi:hypothetical protein
MALKKLIILSLILLPVSLLAETAADYVHRGAQKYIFGEEAAAKAEVASGLAKFPDDPELQQMSGLLRDKKQPEQQDKQSQKDQQQQSKQDKNREEKENQKGPSGRSDEQIPEKGEDQLQAKNEPEVDKNKTGEANANEAPSPSPGSTEQPLQDQPSSSPSPSAEPNEPRQSPTRSGNGNDAPAPSPAAEEAAQGDSTPTPTPGPSPAKKLAGEVKGAGDEQPEQNAQVAAAEPEKDGQMSEKQAELLLRSMKDEERRVQLDERKVARPVYNDW